MIPIRLGVLYHSVEAFLRFQIAFMVDFGDICYRLLSWVDYPTSVLSGSILCKTRQKI